MEIVRKSSFVATPWKNGGGVTHEAFRVPAGGGAFRWRVSVAQIEVSGPFSDFSGYQRTMVLLRGGGVRLRFAGRDERVLRTAGEQVQFDGALPTQCELLAGACTDLNLIVSTAVGDVRSWVQGIDQSYPLPHGETVLVFPIQGGVSLLPGDGTLQRLEEWDLAVAAPDDRVVVSRTGPDHSPPLVFFAAVADNSV